MFGQGKDLLERAIAADRHDVELIFIRYTIQCNIPWFLNYRKAEAEDRKYIEANVDKLSDPGLKTRIRNYLQKSGAKNRNIN